MTDELMAARAALHYWEEPCISGTEGSGAVFFSGCTLRCVFCQNAEIAAGHAGKMLSVDRLAAVSYTHLDVYKRQDHGGLTASALSYQADDLPLSHMETEVHDSRNIFICDRNIINFQHLPTSLLCSRIQDIPDGISQHVKYNNY